VSRTRIQFRRGTSAEWELANPILARGEGGWATDAGVMKIGDGVMPWSLLHNYMPVVETISLDAVTAEASRFDPATDGVTAVSGDGWVGIGSKYEARTWVAEKTGTLAVYPPDEDPSEQFEMAVFKNDVTDLIESADLWGAYDDISASAMDGDFAGPEFMPIVAGQVYTVVKICYDPADPAVPDGGVTYQSADSVLEQGGLSYVSILPDRTYDLERGPLGDLRLRDSTHTTALGYGSFATSESAVAVGDLSVALGTGAAQGMGSVVGASGVTGVDATQSVALGPGVSINLPYSIGVGFTVTTGTVGQGVLALIGSNIKTSYATLGGYSQALGYAIELAAGYYNTGIGMNLKMDRSSEVGIGANVAMVKWQGVAKSGGNTGFTTNSQITEVGTSFVAPTLASECTTKFEIDLVVTTSDGATTALFKIEGLVNKNAAGTARLIGAASVTKPYADAGASGWSATCTAGSGALQINVNPGGTNVLAKGVIKRTEVRWSNYVWSP
jgi:hypothetical protein